MMVNAVDRSLKSGSAFLDDAGLAATGRGQGGLSSVLRDLTEQATSMGNKEVSTFIKGQMAGGVTMKQIKNWRHMEGSSIQALMGDLMYSFRRGASGYGMKGTEDSVKLAVERYGFNYSSLKGKMWTGTQRAFNSVVQSDASRTLLNGPSLQSNLPVIAIPSLVGFSTTSAMLRAGQKKMDSIYYRGG